MSGDREFLRILRTASFLLLMFASVLTNDIGHVTAAGLAFVGFCCLRDL